MTPEIVFNSPSLRVSLAAPDLPNLIVTFDHWMRVKEGFSEPRAAEGFISRGFAHLHLSTLRNDWFLTRDLGAAIEAIDHVAQRHARRATMSFSMGSFGAIALSRHMDFDQHLFVSPQTTYSPELSPFDDRFPADIANPPLARELHDIICDGPPAPGHAAVVFDPLIKLDLMHARRIRLFFENVKFVRLPYGGHPATNFLTRANRTGTVSRAITGTGKLRTGRMVKAYHEVRGDYDEESPRPDPARR